jgi:hypothetical protein
VKMLAVNLSLTVIILVSSKNVLGKNWSTWNDCDKEFLRSRTRDCLAPKPHHDDTDCPFALKEYDNCPERRFPGVYLYKFDFSPSYETTGQNCHPECEQRKCSAILFNGDACTLFVGGFSMRSRIDHPNKNIPEPNQAWLRQSGLMYGVHLLNYYAHVMTSNVAKCVFACNNHDPHNSKCIAITYNMKEQMCFLFSNEKMFSLEPAYDPMYFSWFKRSEFVQGVSLKGSYKSLHFKNPILCADICINDDGCKAITFRFHVCHLHNHVELDSHKDSPSFISWFKRD